MLGELMDVASIAEQFQIFHRQPDLICEGVERRVRHRIPDLVGVFAVPNAIDQNL